MLRLRMGLSLSLRKARDIINIPAVHVQELQIIRTVLHRAGAAFYGNRATEESVPQRECVVRT